MRHSVPLPFLALFIAASGCQSPLYHVSERISLELPWENYQRVTVRTPSGNVTLASAEGTQIRIDGKKRAGGDTRAEARANLEQLEIVARPHESEPATLVIEVDFPEALRRKAMNVDFDIEIPQPCAADVRTSNGEIRARGLRERAVLCTSNGRITVEDVAGTLDADSSNGDIVAESIGGDCDLSTSNGSITALGIEGTTRARTVNGSIIAQASPAPTGQIVLHTSNGSIHVTIPGDLPADLHLSTSNGRVKTRLKPASLGSISHGMSDLGWAHSEGFDATINGGGCRVEATTSNGSITLETQ